VTWHLLTGEYPPQRGGVSDYTRQLARGLAEAGDRVEVWAPPCDASSEAPADADIRVHRLPDRFGPRALWVLTRQLGRLPATSRILVQYVPHAFGWKGANVAFCLWLRSLPRQSTWVMFHEVRFLAEGDRHLPRAALATAHRVMAMLVAAAAGRAFVSIPGWRPMVEPLLRGRASVTWLPVPSAIPVLHDPDPTAAIRTRYSAGRSLVGHFGTYGGTIRDLLEQTLEALTTVSDCHVLLLGEGSDAFRQAFIARRPAMAGRLFATGRLSAGDVSRHVAACDLMLQPYPDGVSSRRTSGMVALSHGLPLVTTAGWLTEPMWAETGAAVLAAADDPQGLAIAAAATLVDVRRREEIGRRAVALYDARFHIRHSVAALRSPAIA
jgi:glycosyltransferase involved in cell wall biosynthesis